MGERGFRGPASHVSQAVAMASVAHETNKQGEDTKLQSIQLESKPSWYSPLLPVSWMLTPS